MTRGSNWAARGHFSPELREARRQAFAKQKMEREARRCENCRILFRTLEEKQAHLRMTKAEIESIERDIAASLALGLDAEEEFVFEAH